MTEEMRSFDDVRRVLSKHVPPPRAFRAAYTLETMLELMAKLGNPQDTYRTVHVAGTSGKTSTSYYVAAMLKATGHKVGLTVSPHIDEVNERIQINLTPFTEKKFCREFSIFMDLATKTGLKPTYFEVLVAFAFWQFAREKVDYAVIEVGLGGLLDGTNVINREDKMCVITDIGLDHTNVLGDKITEIAAQKAGIIKLHNIVVVYEQDEEVMEVLRKASDQARAELHKVLPKKPSELPKQLPLYQRRNWYLAFMVYEFLSKRDGLPALNESQLAESINTYIPARMEIVQFKDKTIVFDGAHNGQKMHALVDSMRHRFKNQKVAVLFSLVKSKKQRTVATLSEITKVADHVIITGFDVEQDLRKMSVRALDVAQYFEQLDFHDWEIVDAPGQALARLLQRKEEVLLITGSFYLLNQIRPIFMEKARTYGKNLYN